eukprot:3459021-Rhodomonas_salina.3
MRAVGRRRRQMLRTQQQRPGFINLHASQDHDLSGSDPGNNGVSSWGSDRTEATEEKIRLQIQTADALAAASSIPDIPH